MGRSGEPSRRSVLDAVGKIVTEQGLEGIRVRQIAAEADLSPGAVLYHFPNNSDLLLAVHKDTVERYVAGRISAKDAAEDAITQLLSVMRAGVPPWADDKVIRVLYEMHGLARRSGPHADLLTELWEREHRLYVEILRTGVEAGVFSLNDPSDDIAAGLLALEDGLVLHLISRNAAIDSRRVVRQFARLAAVQLDCPALMQRAEQSLRVLPRRKPANSRQ